MGRTLRSAKKDALKNDYLQQGALVCRQEVYLSDLSGLSPRSLRFKVFAGHKER